MDEIDQKNSEALKRAVNAALYEVQSEWLTAVEAAAYLKVHPEYLQKLRGLGIGPRFYKIGRLIRYRRADLDAFVLSQSER